jgi:uncharacterized secreted protein with C-terminal beta-propeller domain
MKRTGPFAVALAALVAGLVLVAVALAAPGGDSSANRDRDRNRDGDHAGAAARPAADSGLRRFGSCARLGAYAERHRDALGYYPHGGFLALEDAASAPAAAQTPGTPTNVQEQGVDEPDIVKAHGQTIFALTDNRLRAIDAKGGSPRVLDTLELPEGPGHDPHSYGHQLLVAGDSAMTIASVDLGRPPWTRTVVNHIDLADPARLRAVSTLTLEGHFVSARQNDATVRIVSSSTPEYPVGREGSPGDPRVSVGGDRTWLPQARLRDRRARGISRQPLSACDEIRRPARFSGLDLLSVTTIDLDRGLDPVDSDSLLTGGEVVYAAPRSLYVASERWLDPAEAEAADSQVRTAIHRFDTSSPTATTYTASGHVGGYMLSQWSMSEHEGLLRVASTTTPPWLGAETPRSESFVTVLGERDGELARVGRVGGLGRGEQIYAVRFIGDLGYVVTFREVDPLYTVDLSRPADPRVIGELKIPGYSAYLHPAGATGLIGVGQDARADGRTLGAQISLFDVSNPARPLRVSKLGLGRHSSSEVEYDHHAFMRYEPTGLVVVPLADYGSARPFTGAAAVRIGEDGAIEPLGRISHGRGARAAIRRTLVVDGHLFTVSARGVMAHDLATLADLGWAPF